MTRLPRSLLLWALIVVALTLALWAVSGIDQGTARATPREVTPRGALGAGEQAVIDLFERTRGSVVFITTQARVVDSGRATPSTSRAGPGPDSHGTTAGTSSRTTTSSRAPRAPGCS
jgi:hypothetical protein